MLKQQALLEGKLKGLNLSQTMRQWTKQTGHPLVTVTILNTTHISLKQQRFMLDSLAKSDSTEWYIPFTYSVEQVGSTGAVSVSNQADITNLFDKIEWLNPGKELGKYNIFKNVLYLTGLINFIFSQS